MKEMPLWEIRERAFFSGEQVVVNRMQNIQDQFHAMAMSRSEKPGKYFEEVRNDFESDVMVERLMDPDEKKKRVAKANRAAYERMMGGKGPTPNHRTRQNASSGQTGKHPSVRRLTDDSPRGETPSPRPSPRGRGNKDGGS